MHAGTISSMATLSNGCAKEPNAVVLPMYLRLKRYGIYRPLIVPRFGRVTEFLRPHFRITFGWPTTRKVARPVDTSAFLVIYLVRLLYGKAMSRQLSEVWKSIRQSSRWVADLDV